MQPRRNHRLGLTLLEVLAATVLLSIMALACIPLLRSAWALANSNPAPATPDVTIELRMLADAIVAHADIVGCKETSELLGKETMEFSWPDRPDLDVVSPDGSASRAVELDVLKTAPQTDHDKVTTDHAWLVLRCGESRVVRWMKRSPPPPPPTGEATP